MDTIDVHDLPEPVARALESLAESLRRQLHPEDAPSTGPRVELKTWPGKVIEPLTRREIYEDVV